MRTPRGAHQDEQEEAPTLFVKRPAGHDRQLALPAAGAYVPPAQLLHTEPGSLV